MKLEEMKKDPFWIWWWAESAKKEESEIRDPVCLCIIENLPGYYIDTLTDLAKLCFDAGKESK